MTVRIGYKTPNPRRTSTVQLIADSCKQAGFNVQDIGSDDFFGNGLANGNFDVALFAWSGSPLVTGSSTTYITDGGNNNGKYSNPKVDELTKKLDETTNVDEQTPIIKDIEKQLWADLATIPLFAHPGIDAYTATMKGVVFQPSQSEVTWNMDQWDNTAS
jgi:peptide/nickel transport system substrate-binding protein